MRWIGARMRALLVTAVAAGAVAALLVAPAAMARHFACERFAHPLNVCYGTLPTDRQSIALKARNGSREHGAAHVVFGMHETVVRIRLKGTPKGEIRTAFLRDGGCWGPYLGHKVGRLARGRVVVTLDAFFNRTRDVSVVVRMGTPRQAGAVVACGVISPP